MTTQQKLMAQEHLRVKGRGRHGVYHFAERKQPWTIWCRGWVIGFAETEAEAQKRLIQALGRIQ